MSEENQGPRLILERIFVKDLSMEVPNSKVFTQEWKPELNINLSSNSSKIDDSHYEVVLSVTVSASNQDQPAFIAEVHQAGIFLIESIEGAQLGQLLGAYCPSVLFPFAREAISVVVNKGSFPQLLLAPVNFDAAYQQSLEQQNAASDDSVQPS